MVSLNVVEAPGPCPQCSDRMRVEKTTTRSGRTLAHGAFEARETVHACAAGCRWPSGAKVTRRAACLREALLPGANVGYDVMVLVGRKRFLGYEQRAKIREALREKHGLLLSEGEVSHLAVRFTEYLARLHRARADDIKAALKSDGGWPLHVDATGEAGRGTLLAVIAGWREWVLGSWKISTERADLILPCLRQVVRRFGSPCAVMRDMGKAMIPAVNDLVSELELEIPVLTCHQHYLADVGKDLLEPAHAELRGLFRRHKVRPNLRALVRELGRELGAELEGARQAVLERLSQADPSQPIASGRDGLAFVRNLAQWILDYKADATGLDFPFDRPYLDLYDRAVTARRATDTFLQTPPDDKKVARVLTRLGRYLDPVASLLPFRQVTLRLRRRAALFDEMRGVLRIVAALPENETAEDLDEMRTALDDFQASLRNSRPARGPAKDSREAIDTILAHIETHKESLFGHAIRLPESAGGGLRLVSRTNYLSENGFGAFKHGERVRTGYKNLGHVLETLPAEALLARNLTHEDYVSIVCGSLEKLPEAFADLDRKDREAKQLGEPLEDPEDDLSTILQAATASLVKEDRRIIRTDEMNRCIAAAASKNRPRSPRAALNPTGS
jgi:hypothetical protein